MTSCSTTRRESPARLRAAIAFLLTATTALCLFPGSANARALTPGQYVGDTSQDWQIFFDVKKKSDGTATVKNFSGTFSDNCDGADYNSVGFPGARIKRKEFVFPYGGLTIKGSFKGESAKGTLRYKSGNCDSGKVAWVAERD